MTKRQEEVVRRFMCRLLIVAGGVMIFRMGNGEVAAGIMWGRLMEVALDLVWSEAWFAGGEEGAVDLEAVKRILADSRIDLEVEDWREQPW